MYCTYSFNSITDFRRRQLEPIRNSNAETDGSLSQKKNNAPSEMNAWTLKQTSNRSPDQEKAGGNERGEHVLY